MIVNGRTIVADPTNSAQWFKSVSPHNLAETAMLVPQAIVSAVRHVIASDYQDAGSTFVLTEFRVTDNGGRPDNGKDSYGNNLFATIIYGKNGTHSASIAGHAENGRIVWETYMD